MISSGAALPSTAIEFVRRLTLQDLTPSTRETAFSTFCWQAAQLIPVILYCSIDSFPAKSRQPGQLILKAPKLFQKLLDQPDQLIYLILMTFFNIFRNTAFDMFGQQLFIAHEVADTCVRISTQ